MQQTHARLTRKGITLLAVVLMFATLTIYLPLKLDAAPNFAVTTFADGSIKVTADDRAANDAFGFSVALDGDTAVVTAPGDDSSTGSVYVYVRGEDGTWSEQQRLTASDGEADDQFGYSVALDGDTAVVAALGDESGAGSAYVFTRTGSTWSEQDKLTASDGEGGDTFGLSVAVDGDTAVVGALGDENGTGAAYVFTRTGSTWSEQQKLTASDGVVLDTFGYSVAVDGNTAVVGARGDESFTGSVYVFTRTGSTWSEQDKLTADDGAVGDEFGFFVVVDGDTALVAAPGDESVAGSAYVFTRTGSTWSERQKLTASDAAEDDVFGRSIAMNGDIAVIGADGEEAQTGAAYVFTRTGSTWSEQQKLVANDGATTDQFGYSVAVDGDIVVVAAPGAEDDTGSIYVYDVLPPAQPVITAVNPDTGSSNSDGVTNASVVAFTGTAEAGSTVRLFVDTVQVDSTTAIGGNWTYGRTFTEGTYSITATATDAVGNVSALSDAFTVTIDPTAPEITLLGNAQVTLNVGDTYTDAGATVTDNIDGDITNSIITVNPVDVNTAGSYTVTYNITDTAGNAATQVTRAVNVIAAEDVNRDGIVSPSDALYVINRLDPGTDLTADVNGDNQVTQADVQAVIAALGTQ